MCKEQLQSSKATLISPSSFGTGCNWTQDGDEGHGEGDGGLGCLGLGEESYVLD